MVFIYWVPSICLNKYRQKYGQYFFLKCAYVCENNYKKNIMAK